MKINKTIVNFILDKSGSMEVIRDSTISGFNEYIQTLKKDKESEYEFLLTLFDNGTETHHARPIENVKELTLETYRPDGTTALYDAVCKTIMKTKDSNDRKVITIIMTDGQENASTEFTKESMRTLIKDREAKGTWKFVYLGANQDSYANAASFGISKNATSNFNATDGGITRAMDTMAYATMSYSAKAADNSVNFLNVEQQKDLEDTK